MNTYMQEHKLEELKAICLKHLRQKKLVDNWTLNLINRIEPRTSLNLYCKKCNEVSKIDFITSDDNLMGYCNNCDFYYNDLPSQLEGLIYYNVIQHKQAFSFD